MKTPKTIADCRALNKAAGFHWFDRATMRFFGIRIESGLYKNLCFVTSDLNYTRKRYFNVRRFNVDDCTISTIGKFCSITSKEEAREIARNYEPEQEG